MESLGLQNIERTILATLFFDSNYFDDVAEVIGEKDFIKSKKLVEEQRVDDTGEVIGTYICVKYELTDDSVIRLFSNNFNIVKSIDNYYKLFKKEQKIKTTK